MNRHANYGTMILAVLDECKILPSQEDDFASGIFLGGKITQPVLLRNSIDELNATGKFYIIQNSNLRQKIAELVETVEFRSGIDEKIFLRTMAAVSEIESKTRILLTEAVNPANNITSNDIQFDLESLCVDQTFKNAISTTRSSTFSSVYFTNDIIQMQKEVLDLLGSELSSKR